VAGCAPPRLNFSHRGHHRSLILVVVVTVGIGLAAIHFAGLFTDRGLNGRAREVVRMRDALSFPWGQVIPARHDSRERSGRKKNAQLG
jgi:hypothetical protein